MLRSRKNAGISTLGTSLYVMDKPAPAPDAGAECKALGEIIDRIADKWAVMVVGHLSQTGTMRFNELIRAIPGVSHRMLTLTLRALQRDGIVSRTPYATIPPRVDYALTPLGQSLTGPLSILAEWAREHQRTIEGARETYDVDLASNG